jgi:hypothetical protein
MSLFRREAQKSTQDKQQLYEVHKTLSNLEKRVEKLQKNVEVIRYGAGG